MSFPLSVIFCVIFALLGDFCYGQSPPTVTIPELGTYIGSIGQTLWTNQTILQFLAVQYASAPSKEQRFKPPKLDIPKSGIHNSTVYARSCPVYEYYAEMTPDELQGDLEDCLVMDIYTRNISASNAVLVYIHGGGFDKGASFRRPPNYFLEKDIVYIVPQYRLGPFGFITTNTEEIPGNLGYMDAIASLEWIQKFIKYFGGDPKKVTIWGGSSSAVMVSSMLFSPAVSDDLFRGVILQSGSWFGLWSADYNPVETARKLVTFNNCTPANTVEEINKCLMNAEVLPLLQAYFKLKVGGFMGLGAKPTINEILPFTPYELVYEKPYPARNISVLIGGPRDDGSAFLLSIYDEVKKLAGNDMYAAIEILTTSFGIRDPSGAFSGYLIKKLFTQDQMLEGNFTKLILGLIDISDGVSIKGPTLRAMQHQAKYYPEKTFIYSFEYDGEFAGHRFDDHVIFDVYPAIIHSDENVYVFPFPEEKTHLNAADKKMAMTMIDIWTSFAIDGVPSSQYIPAFPPVTKITGPYMRINTVSTVEENYIKDLTIATFPNSGSSVKRISMVTFTGFMFLFMFKLF